MTYSSKNPKFTTVQVNNYTLPSTDGTTGQVMQTNGSGVITFETAAGGGMAIGGAVTGGTVGSILWVDSSGFLAEANSNLFWDETNSRLGVGTNAPTVSFEVNGSALIQTNLEVQGDTTLVELTAHAYIAGSSSVNAQTGTTYTLASTDNGITVTLSNASAITVTIPNTLPANFHCTCRQLGAGQVTFTGSSVTLRNVFSFTKIAGQYGTATVTLNPAQTEAWLDGALGT